MMLLASHSSLANLDHHGDHFLGVDSEEALLLALRPERLIELKTPHLDSFSQAVAAWLPAVAASLQRPAFVQAKVLTAKDLVKHDLDSIIDEAHELCPMLFHSGAEAIHSRYDWILL